MANIYVRSTDGNNADNGSTWALAKATLAGATAIDVAGDVIYLSQAHAESSAAAQTLSIAGTRSNPVKIICGNDAAEPPTAVSTAARVITTGGSNISIAPATGAYVYGVSFECGTLNTTPTLGTNDSGSAGCRIVYESCSFQILAISGGALTTGLTQQFYTEWRNCTIKFANTSVSISANTSGFFRWIGGSVVSGSSTPASTRGIFGGSANAFMCALIEDVDFSNFSSGVHITNGSGFSQFVIRNCKLPSGWSGNLARLAPTGVERICMYNCSAGTQNYKLWIEVRAGTIRDETTLVRSGGASDGTTPISWKLTTTANANYPGDSLNTDDIVFWCGTTNSAITAEIEILHDSATSLKDSEVWIDVSYLGSSATPIGTLISDRTADYITTAANQDSSSASWTTTGMGNPNTQKLSVTFTPQMKGFVILRVCLAKPSYTIYVCPKVAATGLVNKAQYQILGGPWSNRFAGGAFISIMNSTKQEQIPGNNYIIESTSSSSLTQDLSNYFMAC